MLQADFKEEFVRKYILAAVEARAEHALGFGVSPELHKDATAEAHWVLESLLKQAYQQGFPGAIHFAIEAVNLAGGMATDIVMLARTSAYCVCKIHNDGSLAEQLKALLNVTRNDALPAKYRDLFPLVYAWKLESKPYAYLMEYFPGSEFASLADHLFSKQTNVYLFANHLNSVIQELFRDTVSALIKPNAEELYLSRIEKRMRLAYELDTELAHLGEATINVNGTALRPWRQCLDEIRPVVRGMEPGFVTFVHGDLHPGNVLLRLGENSVQFKLIDPKGWLLGDYIGDVAKLTHYVKYTGPVENREPKLKVVIDNADGVSVVEYEINQSESSKSFFSGLINSFSTFARGLRDEHWEDRLLLAEASNLLGLPFLRLRKLRRTEAIIFFCEGLRLLNELTETLKRS